MEKTEMNISKFKAVWSFVTGGWAGLAVFILGEVNGYLATLDQSRLAQFALVVKSLANAVDALAPLIPSRYAEAVLATTAALAALAQSLADGKITEEELDANIDAVQAAILAWKEARRSSTAPAVALLAAVILTTSGCVYKGGKVVDGTNMAIGLTIPGTEWTINALDYVGGIRVAGQDSTHIVVTNEVEETNEYFGVVRTSRRTKLTADIEPLETSPKE